MISEVVMKSIKITIQSDANNNRYIVSDPTGRFMLDAALLLAGPRVI